MYLDNEYEDEKEVAKLRADRYRLRAALAKYRELVAELQDIDELPVDSSWVARVRNILADAEAIVDERVVKS